MDTFGGKFATHHDTHNTPWHRFFYKSPPRTFDLIKKLPIVYTIYACDVDKYCAVAKDKPHQRCTYQTCSFISTLNLKVHVVRTSHSRISLLFSSRKLEVSVNNSLLDCWFPSSLVFMNAQNSNQIPWFSNRPTNWLHVCVLLFDYQMPG